MDIGSDWTTASLKPESDTPTSKSRVRSPPDLAKKRRFRGFKKMAHWAMSVPARFLAGGGLQVE